MEKKIFQTKNKKFTVSITSSLVFGIIWNKPDIYLALGPIILEFDIKNYLNKSGLFKFLSVLYFIAAFVATYLFFDLTEPSGNNLFVGSMIFLR